MIWSAMMPRISVNAVMASGSNTMSRGWCTLRGYPRAPGRHPSLFRRVANPVNFTHMKRVRVLLSLCLGVATVGIFAPASVSALPTLPTGAGDITPDINWSQFITPIMNAGAISCTVTSVSGTSETSQGSIINPTANPFVDGMKLRNIIADSDADVDANCTSEVTVPTSEITVTGTISAPAMPADIGTAGNLTLKCRATTTTPTISVTVGASFGGLVAGKARITGQGSTGTVNFNCTMGLTFGAGNGIAGTVAGTLSVGDPTNNASCANQTTATCIPVGLSNATVAVSGGSGKLAEAAGSGTYSFNDSFKLAAIDSLLATAGAASLRKQALRPMLAANTDEMKLNLVKGRHSVKSAPAAGGTLTVKSGTQVRLTSSPGATCKVTVTYKRTTVTLGSPKISVTGDATYTISSSAVKKLKSAGAKKNTKLSMTTSCKSGTKTATSKSSPKFAG